MYNIMSNIFDCKIYNEILCDCIVEQLITIGDFNSKIYFIIIFFNLHIFV